MKKKHWLLVAVAAVLVIGLTVWYLINQLNKPQQADGTFTFELIDKDKAKVVDDEIKFWNTDKLVDLMIEKYDVKYEKNTFGTWIQDINDVIGTSNYYLALYIDGEYSMTGVDDIVLVDGMVVSWIATAF